MISKRSLVLCALILFVLHSKEVFSAENCRSQSNQIIANSYITPFGLVTSDTGNMQWVATTTCGRFGGYVEHVQRFNGGRDNTIVGAFYRMPINDSLTARFAVDHLDVDVPSIEVPRVRLQIEYKGLLTVSAEAFYFMDSTDQRLLLWSVSDSIRIGEEQSIGFSLGGSFNKNFGLQDRYYGQIDYSGKLTQSWRYKLIYNYQHQPQHNNLAQLEIAYVF